jgi:serine/threonine-protein phosphatase 2A regulatory subunit B''
MEMFKERDSEMYKNFKLEDIKDEIFDMANPVNKKIITLHDIIKCGSGDTILGLIFDAKAFLEHD